jgi:hypothetical protein
MPQRQFPGGGEDGAAIIYDMVQRGDDRIEPSHHCNSGFRVAGYRASKLDDRRLIAGGGFLPLQSCTTVFSAPNQAMAPARPSACTIGEPEAVKQVIESGQWRVDVWKPPLARSSGSWYPRVLLR